MGLGRHEGMARREATGWPVRDSPRGRDIHRQPTPRENLKARDFRVVTVGVRAVGTWARPPASGSAARVFVAWSSPGAGACQ
jgi:hypothetical protein